MFYRGCRLSPTGMEQIRKDKKEANLKIEFVTRKMQEQEEEK